MDSSAVVVTGVSALDIIKMGIPLWLFVLSWLLRSVVTTVKSKITSIEKGLNVKVSTIEWDLERKLLISRIEFLEKQFDDSVSRNSAEHSDLKILLKEVVEDQKLTAEALNRVNTCMARLAEKLSTNSRGRNEI